jgi:hypothetical protein
MKPQLTKIFKGLSNTEIANHCKSGMLSIKVGELANTTIHVCEFVEYQKRHFNV